MSIIKKVIITSCVIVSLSLTMTPKASAQLYSIKSNIPALLTGTLNASFELSVAKRFSVELPVYINPWKYSEKYSATAAAVLPGARYWIYECFTGPFVGLQAGAGAGKVTFNGTYYKGYFGSVGVSVGYAWMLGVRWNLEAELGGGSYWFRYKTRPNRTQMWEQENYLSKQALLPTRAGLNLSYLF